MPRNANRGRLLSFSVALALLGSLLGALLVGRLTAADAARLDTTRLAATPSCADVLLVLVPGDGEGAGSTPVSAGPTVGRFRDTYLRQAQVAGRTVDTRVVSYRTRSLATLRPANPSAPANRSITGGMARYWGTGITQARDLTLSLLNQMASSCPDQSIVLAGYGQGAGALHRVLRSLGGGAISRRVIGAAIFSDPDRTRSTRAVKLGRPAASGTALGIMPATRSYYAGDVPLLNTYPRVLSVCRSLDVVCDYRGQAARTGIAIAGSYLRYNSDQIDRAAGDLATRTRAIPDPQPEVTTVSASPGIATYQQLGVDILAKYAPYLRWAATGPMPPGLSLAATGTVTGTPTTTGTWTVGYTVRNTANPAYAHPIPGTMVIRVADAALVTATAGGDSSCAVESDGSLWCWGDNFDGQLGIGSHTNQVKPTRVGSSTSWASVNTGGTHTCAIDRSGALYCWGRNDYGQLGDGTRTVRLAPVRISTRLYSSVATNVHHTCAVARDGSLWCWGMNSSGQLGLGDNTIRVVPTRVGTLTGWTQVSTGLYDTCALRAGVASCWGGNKFGQLGVGDTAGRTAPTTVGSGYAQVSAGDTHTCAITTTGEAQCWGANTSGQVGDGTRTLRTRPVPVSGGATYSSVDAGLLSSCAVTTSQGVQCWGSGWVGTLGAGAPNVSPVPTPVLSSGAFTKVEVGWGHACASEAVGAVSCWGFSSAGQLGNGTHQTARTPVRVIP